MLPPDAARSGPAPSLGLLANMIIWGTRTKREGYGFVLAPCHRCSDERVQFVARQTSKFTLYFIPTFTTSAETMLICTVCEFVTQHRGEQGEALAAAAVSQEAMLGELRRRELAAERAATSGSGRPAGGQASPEGATLALGFVVMALGVAFADQRIDDNEAAAVIRALETVTTASASEPVRTAAAHAISAFDELVAWAVAPHTGPLEAMLAQAGAESRTLPAADQARYVGQLAWLAHTVAGASGGDQHIEMSWMDRAFLAMGVSLRDVAAATRLCLAEGG